jgi:GIY-YIG catalytic domain
MNNKNNNTNLIAPYQVAKKVDFGLINNPQNKFDIRENILANFSRPLKSTIKDTFHIFTNVYFFDYDILDIDPNSLMERASKILGFQKQFLIIVYPQYGEIQTDSISSASYPNCELVIFHTSWEDLFKSGLMDRIILDNANSTLSYRTVFNFRGWDYSGLTAMFRAQNIILSGSKTNRHILNPSTHRFSQFISVFESFNLNGVITSYHNVKDINYKSSSFIKAALGPKTYQGKRTIGDLTTKTFDLRWRAIFKEFFDKDIPTRANKRESVSANTQNNEGVNENTQISQININYQKEDVKSEIDFENDQWINDEIKKVLYTLPPTHKEEVENVLKFKMEKTIFHETKPIKIFTKLHIEANLNVCRDQLKGRAGIYGIVNLLDNKLYIGETINIFKRFKQHIKKSSNVPLQKAIKQDGLQNFDFIIFVFVPYHNVDGNFYLKKELQNLEIKYIKSFDRNALYNKKLTRRISDSKSTNSVPETRGLKIEQNLPVTLRRGARLF